MKKIIALVLALCLVLAASAALAEDLTLTIAHIGPQTGPAAVYGLATYRGAQIAADEITAADNGVTIVLLNEDDTHDAEKAVNAYNNVMENGAQMIVGTTTTAPCIAVGAKAYEERVFMLTPSASSTDVTADKDNVYQLCFTDPNQGSASAAVINEKKLGTKIAVIYNNADAYSTGIYQTFKVKAEELGLEIVSTTTFTDETTDFSVQVADAKAKGADLVFLPIYYTPASQILIAANSIGYAPVFFGVDGMDGILTLEGFDTSLAEGVMLLTPFVAERRRCCRYLRQDDCRDAEAEDYRTDRHDDLVFQRRSGQDSHRHDHQGRQVRRPGQLIRQWRLDPAPGFPGTGFPVSSAETKSAMRDRIGKILSEIPTALEEDNHGIPVQSG